MLYHLFTDLLRKVRIMRKLTPEERAAKKAGQVAEVVVAAEPKKKAKKVADAEPVGIGADSFVMPSAKSVEPEAPVAEEKDEKVADSEPASEEVTDK
jgi:hypothetical protein